GDGRSFDWNIILRSELDLASVFLAGGLDPENVREAVMKIHPFAVDVSSGVETGRFKDADKMEAFVRAVRSADTGGGQ
ncbi:MAG: phosphoribosylanthranilate isomerase, partial [Lachnospiraceae bacterium]|nr:phosphoribosylanthranilate isomerase [Lachnospiraceae bacterium]